MHLSRLTTAEMVSLSETFLDPAHVAHQALTKMPEVASMLSRLRDTHQVLFASQSADDLRASELQKAVAALVIEYDDIAQGLDALFKGLVFVAETEDVQARWQRIQEVVLPGNRKSLNGSYQAEADHAVRLQQSLNAMAAPDKGLLKGQFVGKRSVFEIIERWVTVGQQLGQKESERQSVPVTPSEEALQEARNQWAKILGTMASMMQMAELLGELAAEVKQHVLAPMRAMTERRPSNPGGGKADLG